MDFSFSEEQQMLLDTTRRFIAKEYSFEARRGFRRQADGFSRDIWQGFADLGLLAINIPEQHGGLGGGALETMLVMSALGEGLVLEPYLASAVLASKAVTALGNPRQCAALLPALASGEQIAVLAHDEPATRYDWKAVATRAWPLGDGYVLTGHKSVLPHGTSADILLVTARLAAAGQPGALAVFAVARNTPGLRLLPYTTVDGIPACELWLDQAFVPAAAMLDAADDAEPALSLVLDAGLAAVCAEAVGALDKLLAATIQYAKDRKQFGTPIAKFQALQHRMADMVLHIEQARSMSYLAVVRSEDKDAATRSAAMSAAKVVIGQACRFVGQQAVQLHGGMGVTDELDVSHYFKRLMAIELQFGSTDYHLEQFAGQLA
ncbi:acyl-CoA dehydrogenase family protein [Undibacterium sp.]|jgi:alkylation response protein AidB-like acyl-CoA dehydrogenase|uniref:acyl-CoA dehydrogenase family protein n=1 Tax=Undibacterium sp. TaxID=1914977 RepID=UPI002C2C59C1|nr:acyl-CoA dehydrogenase family protein [Undibacterium sp.]HTD04176.1 acyl-CoA dehydrogenase family protein [Undibacterium sp.]